MVDRADERRHAPGTAAGWEESYSFDFARPDGSLGGYVRLAIRPGDGRAWYWAALVEPGSPTVLVRDHDVDIPPGRSLEVRASGLWADMTCETPLEHWTIGLESFGVALDDPAEAFGAERGDPQSLGFDLEWETTAAAGVEPAGAQPGYAQPCAVHGEVLVGSRRVDIEATGWRSHQWGDRDWWPPPSSSSSPSSPSPSSWLTGHLYDGKTFGWKGSSVAIGDDGLVVGATIIVAGVETEASPIAHAPVAVVGSDGRVSRLDRALCRYRTSDGREGVGWAEWLLPP